MCPMHWVYNKIFMDKTIIKNEQQKFNIKFNYKKTIFYNIYYIIFHVNKFIYLFLFIFKLKKQFFFFRL